MLRRFEIYSLDPKAPQAKVAAMRASMRNAHDYIPEVLHSAVGYNKSDVALHFIWEHAYESSESYQRYMVHPFHANIYDRYLLNDSPERIVTDNPYDVGLLGYSCGAPSYFLPPGAARRLILLRLAEGHADNFRAITTEAQWRNPQMILSVFAENTFATRWLDGVTQMLESTTYGISGSRATSRWQPRRPRAVTGELRRARRSRRSSSSGQSSMRATRNEFMRAFVMEGFGAADKAAPGSLPEPRCRPGDLLVRGAAAGVNPTDWKLVEGNLGEGLPAV